MRFIRTTLLTLTLAFSMTGCIVTDNGLIWLGEEVPGSGTIISEQRAIDGVQNIRLSTVGHATVRIGDKDEIIIETDDNLLPYIETRVSNGTLTISTKSGYNVRGTAGIRYSITVRALRGVASSSSGDITVLPLSTDRLEISASSSGDILLENVEAEFTDISSSSSGDISIGTFRGDEIDGRLSSSGDLRIEGGEVFRQRVRISSSGSYDGRELRSRDADIRTSSSGDARVWVTDRLRASTSSSGSIYYRGDPRVDAQSSSSGKVKRVS